jgi:hypothetical protein
MLTTKRSKDPLRARTGIGLILIILVYAILYGANGWIRRVILSGIGRGDFFSFFSDMTLFVREI